MGERVASGELIKAPSLITAERIEQRWNKLIRTEGVEVSDKEAHNLTYDGEPRPLRISVARIGGRTLAIRDRDFPKTREELDDLIPEPGENGVATPHWPAGSVRLFIQDSDHSLRLDSYIVRDPLSPQTFAYQSYIMLPGEPRYNGKSYGVFESGKPSGLSHRQEIQLLRGLAHVK